LDGVGLPSAFRGAEGDRVMRKWIAALALVAGAPWVCGLAEAVAKPPIYEIQKLNIGGVSVGMTPSEVAAALRAAGYTRVTQIAGQSWNEKLAAELAATRGAPRPRWSESGVWGEDYRKGEEEITVRYVPKPQGSVVNYVRYSIDVEAMTEEAFEAAVLRRYGPPSVAASTQSIYCSVGEAACSLLTRSQLPSIESSSLGIAVRTLVLVAGARAERDYEQAVKAELARRMPQLERTTF
jgi:hypothetical protein